MKSIIHGKGFCSIREQIIAEFFNKISMVYSINFFNLVLAFEVSMCLPPK